MEKCFSDNARFRFQNGLFYQNDLPCPSEFEKNYLELRKKEGRLYRDEEVIRLPEVASSSVQLKEWNIRKRSADKLVEHLKRKKINTVFEVGCGNGWLIRYLGKHIRATFCGIDVNETELLQAARVNASQDCFVYADIFSLPHKDTIFDTIILASSIQYFPDANTLLKKLVDLLDKDGEIHIVDSPFYRSQEINNARTRTKNHFSSLGEPEMTEYYFHHSWEELKEFNFDVAYNPQTFLNLLRQKIVTLSPFPWIIIKK